MEETKEPPRKFFDVNNTNFTLEVKEFINKILFDDNDWLNETQRIIHDIFYHTKRGLLAYWLPGTGKTRLGVACAISSDKDVVLISNKGLMSDFNNKIEKIRAALIARNMDTSKLNRFHHLSMNASNVLKQVENMGDAFEIGSFDGKMIIVDEAHHLFNSISNQSKNALGLYRALMTAKNCKIILLTGTPLVKNPWEMVPCFNILAGYELLPESEDDFYTLYGDGKNRAKLENRLSGLISYYAIPPDLALKLLPKTLPEEIVKVDLSENQLRYYLSAREVEVEEAKFFSKQGRNLYKAKDNKSASSYRAKSRRLSNFCYKDGLLKDPSELTDEDCANMHIYAPKLVAMFDKIEQIGKDKKQYCFSLYKDSGILLMARYAKYKGYITAEEALSSSDGYGYTLLSGDLTIKERQQSAALYNNEVSIVGKVNLLFTTIAGAEGFDFLRSRACHLYDPFFHMSAINQIKGRGSRIESHIDLPKAERTIQNFTYLTQIPQKHKARATVAVDSKKDKFDQEMEESIFGVSTDEFIYHHALNGFTKIEEYLFMYQKISVNCSGPTCRICSPTNKILYYPNIKDDMALANPCIPPQEIKKKIWEVKYEDQTYYYDEDKNIIKFDEHLGRYVYLNINDPIYHSIYNAL